jgi:hypothetical protein
MSRVLPILALLALLLAACATTNPSTLDGAVCPPGKIPLELGGCCADTDLNGICDAPGTEPIGPVRNDTIVPQNVTLPATNETNVTQNETQEPADVVGEYLWQDADTIRYISVENLFEVERNAIKGTQYGYARNDEQFTYRIEDRSLAVTNYIEYRRASTTYSSCYVENPRYSLEQCIDDYPNSNPILYGGIRFSAPLDPVTRLAQYEGETPTKRLTQQRFQDASGKQHDVEEVTFTEQNGDQVTFLIHQTFGAPLRMTVVDRWGKQKERFAPDRFAFNSQFTIGGEPRLEPGIEYR